MISPHPDAIANGLSRALACIAYDEQDGHSLDDEAVDLLHEVHQAAHKLAAVNNAGPPTLDFDRMRLWALREAFKRSKGSVRGAARLLGLNETTTYRWRKEFGMDISPTDGLAPAPEPAGDPLADLTAGRYMDLYEQHGRSHGAVAGALGQTESRMYRWRIRMGLPPDWEKEPLRQGEGTLA